MCTSIQKKIEKHFKAINDPTSGLMSFLISNNNENISKENDLALQI